MQSIDRILAMGGNYLLNVGPLPDGTLAPEHTGILRRIGTWFGRVREAFDDAEPASDLIAHDECMLTRKGNSLYVHFPSPPASTGLLLDPIAAAPRRAVLLNTGEELRAAVELVPSSFRTGAFLRLSGIPVNQLSGEIPVIRLDFDDLDLALATTAPAVSLGS